MSRFVSQLPQPNSCNTVIAREHRRLERLSLVSASAKRVSRNNCGPIQLSTHEDAAIGLRSDAVADKTLRDNGEDELAELRWQTRKKVRAG